LDGNNIVFFDLVKKEVISSFKQEKVLKKSILIFIKLERTNPKEKNSNEYKKPLSPFMIYYLEFISKYKGESQKLNACEIAKLAGKNWNEMKQLEKDCFIKAFQLSKEKYIREKQNKTMNYLSNIEENNAPEKSKEISKEE